ncbi:MAG: response regulator [Planctomycetes bacterium]|nr:response regulator [Planctomycetota bacterium]
MPGGSEKPRKLVWVLDCDAQQRDLVRLALAPRKLEVRPFVSVSEVVNALRKGERPDCLLVELKLPFVPGLDLVRKLKHEEKYKAVPVIVLTKDASPASRVEAIKLHVDAYLLKPFQPEELFKTIVKVSIREEPSGA